MEQYQLWWPEEGSAMAQRGMLLLVAVEPAEEMQGPMGLAGPLGLPERAAPCRVVGTLSPGCPVFPARPEKETLPDAEQRIARLLTALGVPANLLGCAYLRTALQLVIRHPEMRRGLMRTLYPQVAQRHAVTARSVERAIRNAIVQTWARGGEERYRRLLGRLGSSVGDRPTNSEFITLLADHLTMAQDGAKIGQIW